MFAGFLLAVRAFEVRAAGGEAAYPDFIEQVYLTEEAALKSVFPGCDEIRRRVWKIDPKSKSRIESRTGWTLAESSVTVFEGFAAGEPQGKAMIAEEIGKFKPITFIVKQGNDGRVERVEVMVYREAVGAEVRRQRFSRQFRGKKAGDPLRINRDILNVTGATMSVQAMTAGVKKALVIMEEAGHGK